MNKKYNWAILGCGKIAAKMASDLKLLQNAVCYAAASTSLERANNFIEKFSFEKAYDSYEEMLSDPKVDIVYIATPHSHHHHHTILSLEAGKAVLCEKSFAINYSQAKEMADKAREKNVLLMEAFWTKFNPTFLKIKQLVENKEYGELKFLRSDFMFNGPYNPQNRLYNADLGGGSLLDIGIYPVFYALSLLGYPEEIKTITRFADTGTEEAISILFRYENGSMASLNSSFGSNSFNTTELSFEEASLFFERDINTSIRIKSFTERQDFQLDEINGLGYHFEAKHFMDCLDNGLIESPELPLDFSLELMKLLDAIRKDAGIVFPKWE